MTDNSSALIYDPLKRRELLSVSPNPGVTTDYVVTLESRVDSPPDGWSGNVLLRYVPDKQILDAESFLDYTRALGGRAWPSPEDIAVAIQDDVNNELVARWTRITVTTDANSGSALAGHSITVEDRQPQWDNRPLLDGLRRY
ncbi:MAG: hypothetical protein ISR48_02235 [Alphaproteobacteria bacterium]|nr:hypothetical protein [Alphaproteobacteria bacterium]